MNITVFIEICIYELVDIIPNLVLALVPFKDFYRFSKKKLFLCIIILYLLLTVSRFLARVSPAAAAFLTVLWVVLYLGFYIISVKSQITKLLFVLLTILNYTSFIVIIFSYCAYHRFAGITVYPYSLPSSAGLALCYLASYPVIYKMMRNMQPLISFPENNSYWKSLWMIPATFCLSYYYNLYANGGIIAFSAAEKNVLFAVFFNFGALFATWIIMHFLQEINTNSELKAENYQLSMQFLQYENLKERIEDARRAKHDFRQSLAVIQSYVQCSDHDGLFNYLNNYLSTVPPDSPLLYCENSAINALLVYYADIAQKNNITFDAAADYPAEPVLSDADAVVLFGNLLENAMEACIHPTVSGKFIRLHIKRLQGTLIINLDNSYSGQIRKEEGDFISSKNGQKGIGTASVKKIVSKYNGILKFNYDDSQFHASVMLPVKTKEDSYEQKTY